jgi:photosystem II stability/assembly factor-like uncharacterized protein
MYTPGISPADPNLILLGCDMSGAYRSSDGGKNWELLHYRQLRGSTRVRPVWHPSDPAVAFAANGWQGNLVVTRDGGRTWSQVPGFNGGVTAIEIDPGHPQSLLLADGRGIWRSSDGGAHWQASPAEPGRILSLHFDQTSPIENRTCIAAAELGIYRSDNGGATWRDLRASVGSGKIIAFAAGSNANSQTCKLYCSVPMHEENTQLTGGILRSDDRGETWTPAMGAGIGLSSQRRGNRPPRIPQYPFLLTTNVNPQRVYAASSTGGRVFRSDDAGRSWRSVLHQDMKSAEFNVGPDYLIDERGGGGDTISGLGGNPANPDHVVVADWMNCFITRDGGSTWAAAHTRSAEEPGRRGKGMRWLDNGLVVTTVWNYYLDPFEPSRHYIAYTDIGFARSTDAGKTWYWQTGRPFRNTTYELAFDPETPGTIWAAFADLHDIPNNNVISGQHYFAGASGGIGISTDFGVTWKDSSSGLPSKPITSVIVDPTSPRTHRTLYASVFEEGVFKSTDGGKSWLPASKGLGAPGMNMRACRLLLHTDGTLFCLVTALRKNGRYVAEGPGLYRSRDGAVSWEDISRSHPLLWPKDFDVDPRDSRVIYLGAADANNEEGGLYKTPDGGQSWKRVARKGPECFGATVHPGKPDWVYMCLTEDAPDCGLWLSKDAGATWKPLEGLPFRNVQRVTFDPRNDAIIYVSTFGASAWRGPAK